MDERWRGVLAALLNPDVRTVLAEAIGDSDLTPQRRTKALARLQQLGLVREGEVGPIFDDTVIAQLLSNAPPRRIGPERFLRADGRIDRYPTGANERRALLDWVAVRVLQPDEVLTERELNDRLRAFADDVAALRRHLVDASILERTRSGSEYSRAASAG